MKLPLNKPRISRATSVSGSMSVKLAAPGPNACRAGFSVLLLYLLLFDIRTTAQFVHPPPELLAAELDGSRWATLSGIAPQLGNLSTATPGVPSSVSDRYSTPGALSFSGSAGTCGRSALRSDLPSGNAPRSLCVWVSASAVQIAPGGILAGYGDDASPGKQGFALRLAPGTGSLQIDMYLGPPLDCGAALQSDRWTSVCAVHNTTALSLYVDGARACSAPATLSTSTAAAAFAVGCTWRAAAKIPVNATGASLDEVRLWDVALTAEQVGHVATAPRPALMFPFHLPETPLAYLSYEGGGSPASPPPLATALAGSTVSREVDPFGLPQHALACAPCAITATPPAGLLPAGNASRSVCFWSWMSSAPANEVPARIVEWGSNPSSSSSQPPPSVRARFGVRLSEFFIFTFANDAVDYQCNVPESLRLGSGAWRHVCAVAAGAYTFLRHSEGGGHLISSHVTSAVILDAQWAMCRLPTWALTPPLISHAPFRFSAGNLRRFYLDGALLPGCSTGSAPQLNTSAAPSLRVGWAESDTASNSRLNAALDDIAIYAAALTEAQVAAVHSRGNALRNPSFEAPYLTPSTPATDIPGQTPVLHNWTIPVGGGARLLLASAGANDVRHGRQMLSLTVPTPLGSGDVPSLQQVITGLRPGTAYMLSSLVWGDFSSIGFGVGRRGVALLLDGRELARLSVESDSPTLVSAAGDAAAPFALVSLSLKRRQWRVHCRCAFRDRSPSSLSWPLLCRR